VSGTNYYANETVAVRLHVTVLAQGEADADGSFTTRVEVPESAPPPSFPTSVVATGKTSAKSAEVPLKIVK